MGQTRYAFASCHVERPLDDRVWAAFARFQARRPGGFVVAALMRPPDPGAGEDEARWVARAREAAARGPLGHHTHWGGETQARPVDGEPAGRVRREADWIRSQGLEPRFFCGGGWYMDAAVAEAAADLGYVDATATAYRQTYLADDAPRVSVAQPSWLRLDSGRRLLELPATHSVGMLARALARPLPPVVHVHFHDWDLLDRRRAAALAASLRVLRLRRRPLDLARAAELAARDAPDVLFRQARGIESPARGQQAANAGRADG
jgi:hypothetical protein